MGKAGRQTEPGHRIIGMTGQDQTFVPPVRCIRAGSRLRETVERTSSVCAADQGIFGSHFWRGREGGRDRRTYRRPCCTVCG
jgi:hypothetical protein